MVEVVVRKVVVGLFGDLAGDLADRLKAGGEAHRQKHLGPLELLLRDRLQDGLELVHELGKRGTGHVGKDRNNFV